MARWGAVERQSLVTASRRVSWSLVSREPFRLFFPSAVLVGMLGVALWPLHFAGLVAFYPGQSHTRLMTYGFFGGVILGFLWPSLPGMLSAEPLKLVGDPLLLLLSGTAGAGVLDAQ